MKNYKKSKEIKVDRLTDYAKDFRTAVLGWQNANVTDMKFQKMETYTSIARRQWLSVGFLSLISKVTA